MHWSVAFQTLFIQAVNTGNGLDSGIYIYKCFFLGNNNLKSLQCKHDVEKFCNRNDERFRSLRNSFILFFSHKYNF